MNITIIGVGYVGLVTGIVHAYLGHQVVCLDKDENKIYKLKQGILPIFEPGLDIMLDVVKDRITFTTDYEEGLKGVEVIFISVDTPSKEDGTPNIKSIYAVSNSIAETLEEDNVIMVNKSTVPIGSGYLVESLIKDSFKKKYGPQFKKTIHVVSNPEFLREGSAIIDTLYPDRIVIGTSNEYARDKMVFLYRSIVERTFEEPFPMKEHTEKEKPVVVTTDIASAELIKYSANAFLALKISFINEIACLSEKIGADIMKVSEGIGLDRRIGKDFLNAGIGWGGSCFGKDTSALIHIADKYDVDMNIVDACRKQNYSMRKSIIKKIQSELKIMDGKTIALMGLSFKAGTDDLRDSPAVDIAKSLLRLNAKVKAYDPIAMERAKSELEGINIEYANSFEELFEQVDAVVLATDWNMFQKISWNTLKEKMKNPLIFDGRNYLNWTQLNNMGFKVIGIGR